MNIYKDTIELLSPAKDLECGKTAIDCGADAVYMGAAKFGAREAAGNSIDDIAALVDYAHRYWACVYVTVNTLLYDREIPEALKLIEELHAVGIDGLIIQDVGLLECDLPPIPLIASTQMHNHTPERVAFLEKVGLKRAILARELTLEEISQIREATDIELEVFVHGALCVCYSGQCYLSHAIGGRSGNRGQCAQPCRKCYSLVDSSGRAIQRDKHLLSLRDLNLSDHLRELLDAGITSFKIEGRLKDRAYIMNVVSYYRQKLDEILPEMGLRRSSSGTSAIDFSPDPAKTFNRGYTDYFLHGRTSRIGSIDTPKMTGEFAGKVEYFTDREFTLDRPFPFHRGDGICFFDRKGEMRGTSINGVRGDMVTPDKMRGIDKDITIYRNHDHEFLTRLEKSRQERRIEVNFALREIDNGFTLASVDEAGTRAEVSIECEKTPAEKPDQALDNIRKQLAKTGGTHYKCGRIDIELALPRFIPIGILNSLRRDALDKLDEARAAARPVETGGPVVNDYPYPEPNLGFEGNVLNGKAEAFYRRHGVGSIEPAAESGADMRGRTVMTTRYCLKHQLGLCGKRGLVEPLYLVGDDRHRMKLVFDCEECRMLIEY